MISESIYNIRNKFKKYHGTDTDTELQHNNINDDFNDITIIRDIQYYDGINYVKHKHCYDIYYNPDILNTKQHIPIIFSIHGGGYQRGDKSSNWRGSPILGHVLARHNYIVVAINYRLAPHSKLAILLRSIIFPLILYPIFYQFTHTFYTYYTKWSILLILIQYIYFWWYDYSNRALQPYFFDDPVLALKHVIQNIHKYIPNADVNSIYLHGHSAGAHIASLLACDTAYCKLAQIDVSCIKAVIGISGIYNVKSPIGTRFGDIGFYIAYASSAFGHLRSTYDSISPLTYITSNTVPHLLINAASDMGLEKCATEMFNKFKQHNVKVYHYTVPNTTHSTIASLLHKHQAHKHIIEFIQEIQTNNKSSIIENSSNIN